MDTYKDAHYRSILKAISFRFVATATTIAIVFILTRSLALSAIAGVADVVSKLILYYLIQPLPISSCKAGCLE